MKKRIICALLAFALIWGLTVPSASQAHAANDISASDIVSVANSLVGKYPKYVSGGTSPSAGGFDCTGLVYYIYHTQLGHSISLSTLRSKSALLAAGTKITNKADLQPGDIIQYTIFHIGIYIGNNTVIHSGSSKGVSKVSLNASGLTFAYGIRLPNITQDGSAGISACAAHTKGAYLWCEKAHPHYNYFTCVTCGQIFTDGTTEVLDSCTQCQALTSAELTLTSIEYGNWVVVVPNSSTIALYANAANFSAISSYTAPDNISFLCPQRAVLSDGSTRYGTDIYEGGDKVFRWFTLTSGMSVEDQSRPITYTVALNANGGYVSLSAITVQKGDTYNTLPQPTRDGYAFLGWYTAAEGGSRVENYSSLAVDADHTLYAHWNNIYEATLDPNGGTVSGSSSPIKVEYKDSAYFPVPVRQGYTFDGWYTERVGGENILTGWTRYSEGAYFYAHWTPIPAGTCVVTFDAQGGTCDKNSVEVTIGGTYGSLPVAMGQWGFQCIGWYTAPIGGTLVLAGDPIISNADHTLYAHYEQVLYEVIFDPNGGTVQRQFSSNFYSRPEEYYIGAKAETYGNLPAAIWEGHTFLGWYTAPDGGYPVTGSSRLFVEGNHTLYAHWS